LSGTAARIDRIRARTDGNGWKLLDDGVQRRWTRRFLGIVAAAAPNQVVVNAAALPAGVATLAAVDVRYWLRCPEALGRVVRLAHQGTDASTALTINAQTVDATNLSANVSVLDVFCELVERLPG
jgi:DNA-binding transcriptional LysR family regulator